jgi:predicted nucleic acid-binding protein
MAETAPARLRFALDTNVLIDLGEELPFAQRFLATHRNSGLAVPPTVVQELVHISQKKGNRAQPFALAALQNMRRWNITPYDLRAVGHGITDVSAQKLMRDGILEDGECNDGYIIIETALHCIPILISSDIHLLKINPSRLVRALNEFHLPPVTIYHPKSF